MEAGDQQDQFLLNVRNLIAFIFLTTMWHSVQTFIWFWKPPLCLEMFISDLEVQKYYFEEEIHLKKKEKKRKVIIIARFSSTKENLAGSSFQRETL